MPAKLRHFTVAALFSIIYLMCSVVNATQWPDVGWAGDQPRPDALLSAIAFVSPVDLYFYQVSNIWKKLDKKYHSLGVDFLIVAHGEPGFPFSPALVTSELAENNYKLPVFIDDGAGYSKLWRAYVSPTVNLVLRSGKLVGFDSSTFDPAIFEKALQKALRESGSALVPPREYTTDGETRTCGHAQTTLLSEKFQRAWGSKALNLEGVWTPKTFWMEKNTTDVFSLETILKKSNFALVAGASASSPAKILVTLNGLPLPPEVRGRDVQEDKSGGTFINVRASRLYEVLGHSQSLREGEVKLKMSTSSKGLTIWSIQTVPWCQIFS